MMRAGRVGSDAVVLFSTWFVAACGNQLSSAQCEASGSGNQQALQSLNTVLSKNRDHSASYLARARCFYFLGAYAQAVQDASEVIRREPKEADAYLFRAKAGKMLGQIPQALNDYAAAIRLHPSADAYYGRG